MMGMMRRFAAQQGVLANLSTEVVAGEYRLSSDGTGAYIDTGLQNLGDDCDLTGGWKAFSGSRVLAGCDNGGASNLQWMAWATNSVVGLGWNPSQALVNTAASASYGQVFELAKTGAIYTIDGTSYSTTYENDGCGYNMWLFCRNEAGSPSSYCEGFMDLYVHYDGTDRSTYKRNMWPVPSGMTANGASSAATENGMYDSVSDSYFYDETGDNGFTIEAIT